MRLHNQVRTRSILISGEIPAYASLADVCSHGRRFRWKLDERILLPAACASEGKNGNILYSSVLMHEVLYHALFVFWEWFFEMRCSPYSSIILSSSSSIKSLFQGSAIHLPSNSLHRSAEIRPLLLMTFNSSTNCPYFSLSSSFTSDTFLLPPASKTNEERARTTTPVRHETVK